MQASSFKQGFAGRIDTQIICSEDNAVFVLETKDTCSYDFGILSVLHRNCLCWMWWRMKRWFDWLHWVHVGKEGRRHRCSVMFKCNRESKPERWRGFRNSGEIQRKSTKLWSWLDQSIQNCSHHARCQFRQWADRDKSQSKRKRVTAANGRCWQTGHLCPRSCCNQCCCCDS